MKKTIFERRRQLAKHEEVIAVGFYCPKTEKLHEVQQVKGDPDIITKAAFQVSRFYQTRSYALPAPIWFASTEQEFRVFCLTNEPELITDDLCDRIEQKLNFHKLKEACFQA